MCFSKPTGLPKNLRVSLQAKNLGTRMNLGSNDSEFPELATEAYFTKDSAAVVLATPLNRFGTDSSTFISCQS